MQWNPQSGIREILLVEMEILGFGIRNTAQGIRNYTNDYRIQNPSSIYKDWNPVPGMRNPLHEILNILDSLSWGENSRNLERYSAKDELSAIFNKFFDACRFFPLQKISLDATLNVTFPPKHTKHPEVSPKSINTSVS